MKRSKRIRYGFAFAAAAAVSAGAVFQIMAPPVPRVIYNASESAPRGWYWLNPSGEIVPGVRVAAFATPEAQALAEARGYLPSGAPLLKTVWAVGGDRICIENQTVRAPNHPDIHALARDGAGRDLPQLSRCFELAPNEIFLVSNDVQASFDSRYFGPVHRDLVLGTVRYLGGARKKQNSDGVSDQGGARGFGAEGKIKTRRPPKALSPCLHIFFGRAPHKAGRPGRCVVSPTFAGESGRPPSPQSHLMVRNVTP
ncbi:MAG: S26 family signal peptidase [Pseudomonadota bacterium]